jgi:hypothetical protein
MSTSLPVLLRAILAATALSAAPAIANAQAPQTKPCKDGTNSSRSTFACWGHGGVDTTHHRAAEPVQAGAPRVTHAEPTARKESKASAHHAKVEHREAHAGKKKQQEGHRGWLPWRHKKEHDHDGKKAKKRASASRLPVPERPNGRIP